MPPPTPPRRRPPRPAGKLPTRWPKIFPRLQYLLIQFNDLFADVSTNPAVLPSTWTAAGTRGFQSLSMLTLYPGNDAICSVPSLDGGFDDVNLGEPGRGEGGAARLPACCLGSWRRSWLAGWPAASSSSPRHKLRSNPRPAAHASPALLPPPRRRHLPDRRCQ